MSLKLEFVKLADQKEANMSALCRRFDISRPTGYKWLERYREEGPEGLEERSRRPDTSPNQTPGPVEEAICTVRKNHPAWGGRKIRARLQTKAENTEADNTEADNTEADNTEADNTEADNTEAGAFDPEEVPAASTCQAIIKRRGLLDEEEEKRRHAPFKRFEKEAPNRLWQMDFKGHFPLTDGERCHPLTIVDDHSRFALALTACADERRETVKEQLTAVFRRYGLPRRILCDNGLPWGVPAAEKAGRPLYTDLNRWLFRLGIDVVHGRPYHPETQGKAERFHRSLTEELLQQGSYESLPECQTGFDQWRRVYNLNRPHEALDLDVPASHYQPSGRPFPPQLPDIRYPSAEHVRAVSAGGQICFAGNRFYVGEAFDGHPVALRRRQPEEASSRQTTSEGATSEQEGATSEQTDSAREWAVYFCHKKIRVIESKAP